MKKVLLLTIIILLFGCKNKKTELTIKENHIVSDNFNTKENLTERNSKELIKISSKDSLKILFRADFAPAMYLDKNGVPRGYYTELVKHLMKSMEQEYQLIPYWDAGKIIQGYKTGDYHMAIAISHVPDYLSLGNMSIAYDTLNYVIFVQIKDKLKYIEDKKSMIEQLSGKRVGVSARGNIYQTLRHNKNIKLVEYPTTTEALNALNRGEVDVVPALKDVGNYYIEENNWSLTSLKPVIFSFKASSAFSKKLDKSIVDSYNRALSEAMESGYMDNYKKDFVE